MGPIFQGLNLAKTLTPSSTDQKNKKQDPTPREQTGSSEIYLDQHLRGLQNVGSTFLVSGVGFRPDLFKQNITKASMQRLEGYNELLFS